MRGRLRLKVAVILVVVTICAAFGVYPVVAARHGLHSPGWLQSRQLKLGLDLKGGVHLVLRVETDVVVRDETTRAAGQFREALASGGADGGQVVAVEAHGARDWQVVVVDATHFQVDARASTLARGFDDAVALVAADFEQSRGADDVVTFAMKPAVAQKLRADAVTQARETIERRVNELGVSEPGIAQQGRDGDQILLQLPGVTDVERAKAIVRSTGRLELKFVNRGPSASRETWLANGQVPAGMEIVPAISLSAGEPGSKYYYLVETTAVVTGRDVRTARPTVDENGLPAVGFTLNADGARKFGKATAAHIGRQIAIVLDGRVQSAPRIEERIRAEGRIAGIRTQDEARNLSLILRTGALPAPITYLEERTIGASLGADAIRSGLVASVVGLLLVVAFMLAYYKWSGINAVVALTFNLIIMLGLMAYAGSVMTLPGIAGFVLTIGIGVDSNVLIFERIKEELDAGRGVRASIHAGFSRVFLTLLDTHVAGLVSAAFLWQFGTGPIRGFAISLSVGLLSNLFTSTFVSKTIFELMLARRSCDAPLSI